MAPARKVKRGSTREAEIGNSGKTGALEVPRRRVHAEDDARVMSVARGPARRGRPAASNSRGPAEGDGKQRDALEMRGRVAWVEDEVDGLQKIVRSSVKKHGNYDVWH